MNLFRNRKLGTLGLLAGFVTLCAAATNSFHPVERNLKVLPKDIPDEKLDSIMKTYTVALGVDCKFCHHSLSGFPDSLDYASDAEPMKTNAREMMRMVIDINSKYFYFDSTQRPEYLHTISCRNCHRGQPIPPGN